MFGLRRRKNSGAEHEFEKDPELDLKQTEDQKPEEILWCIDFNPFLWSVIFCLSGFFYSSFLYTELLVKLYGYRYNSTNNCIMDFLVPYQTNNICRGLENCSVCEQIKGFDDIVHQNLTEEYFNQKYSRTLRPVVVRNIALDWPVIQNLDFDWVRDIYLSSPNALWNESKGEDCMFTSYKYYQFRNFHSVFRLTTSKMYFGDTGRSWYISWVVCQETVLRELVKLIKVPAFISQNNSLVNYTNSLAPTLEPSNQHNPISTDQPSDSTTTNSNITDSAENKTSVEKPILRLFIGTPGASTIMGREGQETSFWDLQIKGTREIVFTPPPECSWYCPGDIRVQLYPGDVLVYSSDYWKHEVNTLGSDLSISLLVEY